MELSANPSNWVQEPIIICFLILLVIFRNLSFVILDPLQVIKTYLLPLLQQEEDFVKKYGKWAVVTGCTQGIGRSYVDELAKRGMNLVLISKNQIKLSELEEHLKQNHKGLEFLVIAEDLTHSTALNSIINTLEAEKLDIGVLVNNVGILGPHWMPFLEMEEKDIKDIMNVNMMATVSLCHAILPGMVKKGKGAVVNISSVCSNFSVPYLATYTASKSFVSAFTKTISTELKNSGVTVQLIEPGHVKTEMAKLFANNLSAVVPTPSTFVKSAIKRLGYSAHTCGYWPHSLEMWFRGVCIPDWILSTGIWGNIMLKEGTKHYEHALRVLKADTTKQ